MANSVSLEKAALYEKYRLPYTHEVVDDLLGRTGQVNTVADIGAGTGQLARLFAERCAKLYAIEPEPAMLEVASKVLAGYSGVEVRAGFAEDTSLPDQSIDLIVVGSAFHRFKPEACDEFRRILKPGGWLALIQYEFTNRRFNDLLFPKLAALSSVASNIDKKWHRMPIEAAFGDVPIETLRYPQTYVEDWTAFWGNACAGVEAPERDDPVFAQFEAVNREVFDAFAVDGNIVMEYETSVTFGQPSGTL